MRIKKEVKEKILREYNQMASNLYKDLRNTNSTKLRLMIQQVITEHINSRFLEDLTVAKKITKNKVTKEINRRKALQGIGLEATECSFGGKSSKKDEEWEGIFG